MKALHKMHFVGSVCTLYCLDRIIEGCSGRNVIGNLCLVASSVLTHLDLLHNVQFNHRSHTLKIEPMKLHIITIDANLIVYVSNFWPYYIVLGEACQLISFPSLIPKIYFFHIVL